jgi:hypothetical protein
MTEFSEDVLERELQYRLHEEMSGMSVPPGLAATVRRRHHRRAMALRIAGAVPVVLAVALAVTLVSRPGGPTTAPAQADGPRVLDVNYVSQRTSTALESASDYVLFKHSAYSDGYTTDEWVDATTDAHRINELDAAGGVTSATVFKGASPDNALTVNYTDRTFLRQSMAVLIGVAPAGQENDGFYRGDFLDPDEVRGLAADGRLKVIGPESLAGVETVHLQWLQVEGYTLNLWVDATTYLPVRMDSAGGKGSSRTDLQWLPRSETNLARFELSVPAGFTQTQPEDPRAGR